MKLQQEAASEEHGGVEPDFAAVHGGGPVENLDSGGNANQHSRVCKKGVGRRRQAHSEHMVRPDTHPINAMATMAATMAGLPNSGLRENTGITSERMAKIGKIKT